MARTLVLGCSLAIICLLAFLTLSVAAGPLVRSSYHAEQTLAQASSG